jgi:hypothetical protein
MREIRSYLITQRWLWCGLSYAALIAAAPASTADTDSLIQQLKTHLNQAQTEMNSAPLYAARQLLPPDSTATQLPAELQLLRGLIGQKLADYPAARRDFEQVLASPARPTQAQAHVGLALLSRIAGDYAAVRPHCLTVQRLGYKSLAKLCLGSLLGREGQAQAAYQLLDQAIFDAQGDGPAAYQGIALELAMLSQRLGHIELARHNFARAFSTKRQDLTVLARYADFLLEQQEAAAVLEQLPADNPEPRFLLRRALACQALAQAECVNALRPRLVAAYQHALAQGDRSLLDEEARFLLQIQQQAAPALRQLESLWTQRKEPEVARWYLEAALAVGEPERARPVLAWMQQQGWEDLKLHALAARLAALPAAH